MKSVVTVCTATYNRANLLERPFKSLLKQTSKNFKWLIIDDGSTDNTEEVVNSFKGKSDFVIEYHKKANGGRHTALNYSYNFIETEYVINLDSDDELVPDAIEKIEMIYNVLLKRNDYDRFWQISGRCIDSSTHNLVGKKYPNEINDHIGLKQRKIFTNIKGEKSNCRKVEILKQYPFPEYNDTKFITENTVWEKIGRKYDSYCTNEVFRIYYTDSDDSLAKGKVHQDTRMNSRYYYSLFCLNELYDELLFNKNVIISIINLGRVSIYLRIPYKKVMSELKYIKMKVIVSIVGYPLGYIYLIKSKELKYRKKDLNE